MSVDRACITCARGSAVKVNPRSVGKAQFLIRVRIHVTDHENIVILHRPYAERTRGTVVGRVGPLQDYRNHIGQYEVGLPIDE